MLGYLVSSILELQIMLQWMNLWRCIFSIIGVVSSGLMPGSEVGRSKCKCKWHLLGIAKFLLHRGYTISYSQWECSVRVPVFPTSLPTECNHKLLNFCQSDGWEMVPQCCFNLHFFYHKWNWTFFCMFKVHFYNSFCELFVDIFCPLTGFKNLWSCLFVRNGF